MRILRALAAADAPQTATDVAKRIDLPRPTTFRLLMTLEDEGMVDRQDTFYSLGWDIARIARHIDPATGLVPRIKDTVDEFADEVAETVTFSLRQGRLDLDLVLQSAPRLLAITMTEMYGMRWPVHASATGKLLLAELPDDEIREALAGPLESLTKRTVTDPAVLMRELHEVRELGWAVTDEELEDGIIAYAAPVRDGVGSLIGAISVVGPANRIQDKQIDADLTNRLIAATHRVEERMNPSPGD